MKQTVLITGASSGIGKALAEQFAADGCRLVLTARNEADLLTLKAFLEVKYTASVSVIPIDLSTPNSPDVLFTELQKDQITIDVLINNAGFGIHGAFVETHLPDELSMIDLHVRNLTHLTKLFLPGMLVRKQGGILNVASTAAFQPGPLMAVYYATKSYVLSFTEALANELRGTGIRVSVLCPGPTETKFANRAKIQNSKLFSNSLMNAKAVAKAGYVGYRGGKTVIIPGFRNRIMAASVRFAPRYIVPMIVRHLHQK
ncbi:SDR family NAD(P)-dependent oxidoreductase [Paenibacillus sp. GCM10027628]|uniref:SDR family NAD(P)-dependent oxidoreductase n=1 Tax=Paenibacillus sp. GCM10027628 TaxID=3273413 RepID=UPI003643C294